MSRCAWYAGRYGLSGAEDRGDGILDLRSEEAIGKTGHLIVGRAVVGNVYPITRACTEDHEIEDFTRAARKGQLASKWHDGKSLKQGYDAHYVRVKKTDPGNPRANYAACPDAEIFATVGIADELVIADEEQLLAEYLVRFEVCER